MPSWCRVQIKISADWLLGHTTEAPVLAGHGPLPTDVALRLIADAGWQRIVYAPLTGALLDVGTTVHDPPGPLRRHVLVRDDGCTQPSCGNPRVDLDHNPVPERPDQRGESALPLSARPPPQTAPTVDRPGRTRRPDRVGRAYRTLLPRASTRSQTAADQPAASPHRISAAGRLAQPPRRRQRPTAVLIDPSTSSKLRTPQGLPFQHA